jgi:enterochelin esterase-like enzyme
MDSLPARLQTVPEDQRPRLWLDAGDKDSEYQTVQTFEKALNTLGLPHEWHSYLGWHEETYWSAHVEEYLRWYAAEWKP